MKTITFLLILILLGGYSAAYAQKDSTRAAKLAPRILTIEPAIGIHTNFATDFLMTNLVQWNPTKRLSVAAHTSFNINNPLLRDFNYIQTKYNYTLNQKFGVGASFYSKKSTHTFFIMAGLKYTSYEEILTNPNFSEASASINSISPDYGLMYSFKRGWKKFFFTSRVYLPLYPWPTKSFNISYVDGNSNNIALEFGVGIKLQ